MSTSPNEWKEFTKPLSPESTYGSEVDPYSKLELDQLQSVKNLTADQVKDKDKVKGELEKKKIVSNANANSATNQSDARKSKVIVKSSKMSCHFYLKKCCKHENSGTECAFLHPEGIRGKYASLCRSWQNPNQCINFRLNRCLFFHPADPFFDSTSIPERSRSFRQNKGKYRNSFQSNRLLKSKFLGTNKKLSMSTVDPLLGNDAQRRESKSRSKSNYRSRSRSHSPSHSSHSHSRARSRSYSRSNKTNKSPIPSASCSRSKPRASRARSGSPWRSKSLFCFRSRSRSFPQDQLKKKEEKKEKEGQEAKEVKEEKGQSLLLAAATTTESSKNKSTNDGLPDAQKPKNQPMIGEQISKNQSIETQKPKNKEEKQNKQETIEKDRKHKERPKSQSPRSRSFSHSRSRSRSHARSTSGSSSTSTFSKSNQNRKRKSVHQPSEKRKERTKSPQWKESLDYKQVADYFFCSGLGKETKKNVTNLMCQTLHCSKKSCKSAHSSRECYEIIKTELGLTLPSWKKLKVNLCTTQGDSESHAKQLVGFGKSEYWGYEKISFCIACHSCPVMQEFSYFFQKK